MQLCKIICYSLAALHVSSDIFARNMYSSQGITNYPTQLHLIGHFRIFCHDARKHEYQV